MHIAPHLGVIMKSMTRVWVKAKIETSKYNIKNHVAHWIILKNHMCSLKSDDKWFVQVKKMIIQLDFDKDAMILIIGRDDIAIIL